jgi:hypothetical protein
MKVSMKLGEAAAKAGVDFVIRSAHNRHIADSGTPGGKLEEHLERLSLRYGYEMEVGASMRGA